MPMRCRGKHGRAFSRHAAAAQPAGTARTGRLLERAGARGEPARNHSLCPCAVAASMDAHFRDTPLPRNLPVLLALVDFWNAQAPGASQRVIIPYAHALSR